MPTPELKTAADWLKAARQQIDALDARLLLQQVTGYSRTDLICRPDAPVDDQALNTLQTLLHRRAAGEPLAYLTGETRFRAHPFKVTPGNRSTGRRGAHQTRGIAFHPLPCPSPIKGEGE